MRRALYVSAVFVSALLLFMVQPLLGKRLLPWFGGTPSTWTACMLFFQCALLVGYALADGLIRRSRGRVQLALSLLLPLAALALLPLGPSAAQRPLGESGTPVIALLALLATHAGLPYVALATASPLLQHWYERGSAHSPYGLYAWSNAGSLLGLLLYPFALEPLLALDAQAKLWSAGFVVYVALLALCGLVALRPAPAGLEAPAVAPLEPSLESQGAWPLWLALACVPSAMLLAVTNYITVDVAVVPFLWVLPLVLYLASFIAAFDERRWLLRSWLQPLWIACTAALGISLFKQGKAPLLQQIGIPLAALLACALLCHAELARTRPPAARLSRFYLAIAAGGALGGAFVAVLAPLLFAGFYELQLATLAAHALIMLIVLRTEPCAQRTRELRSSYLGLGLAIPLLLVSLWVSATDRSSSGSVIEQHRSFYGVLRVTQWPDVRVLSHGRIRHGMQFRDAARADRPTMYFGPDSGIGRALRLHHAGQARAIGVLGLGVGTLAAYGAAGDTMRFYELDPGVIDITQRRFGFLHGSRAQIAIVPGDGRLSLERSAGPRFDLLVLDAFSSDSVPAHLLTLEAFAIYLRHLQPDGVIAANVSNRHLAVERVVAGAAAHYGLSLRLRETASDSELGYARARWALLARNPALLDPIVRADEASPLDGPQRVWTDDFSDLLHVLR